MEDFRRFLPSSPDMISNANACSRAFGAPSKCAVSSFAHYSEIFGNFFASKSSPVPILDYPLLDDDQVAPGVPDTNFEYADIFGSVHAGDYDGSCEPVVAENSRPGCFPTKLSSRDVKGTRQQKVVANSKNYHALSIANSQHHCGEAKGTRDLSQDSAGTVEEVDHFEETVSECPVEKSHKDPQADYIQHDYKLGDPKNATVSNHSLPNSLANHTLQSESKENPGGVLNASKCDPTIRRDQNSSCNPFSFSTSGKDTTSHVNVFLTVTDIDLRTEPSVLPPPLRPPPKLDSPRQMKVHQDEWNQGKPLISTDGYYLGFGCKTPALEVICENESSPLSHVVEDLSSTAAPSADAIREAVDKAKSKLKSAKESLERTRVNFRDCMKHDLYEDKKINERKKSGSVKESLVLLDDEAQGASCIRTNESKEYIWEKKQDVIGIGCSNLCCEENMGHIELRKESLCKSQEDSCRSLNTHKLEHGTAETNANKQFYELVNNEESFEGILKWDTDETNSRPSGRILLHKQKTAEAIRELNVIDKNEKLRMVDETNEQVSDCILKEPEGACRYKAGDIIIEATQDSGQMEEYKNKVAAEAPEQEEEIGWKSRTVAHRHTYDEKRLKAVRKHEGKKRLEADFEHVDDGIRLNVADKNEDSFNSLKTAIKHEEVQKPKAATSVHTEEEKTLNAAFGFERENEMMKAAREHEVVEIRLKASCGNPWEEKGETTTPLPEMVVRLKDDNVVEESNSEAANEGLGSEECDAKVVPHEWIEVETKLRSALETHIDGEHEKKIEAAGQLEERVKLEEMMKQGHGYYVTEESLGMRNRNEKPEEIYDTRKIQHPHGVEGNENAVETGWKVYKGSDDGVMKQEAKGVKLQVHEVQILKQARQVRESEAIENKRNSEENEENCKKVNAAKRVLLQEAGKCKEFSDSLNWEHHEKAQNTARTVQELERNENKLKLVKEAFEVAISDKCSSECRLAYDMEKSNNIEKFRENTKEAEVRNEEVDPLDSCLNSGDKSFKTDQQVTTGQDREREDKTTSRIYEKEKEKEERIQREREREKERLRKIEEEIKREREREKNKIALERPGLEASARVFVQAQERPEKTSLDRVTTEAQRGLTEAREGAKETSFDDARSKVETAEKASSDATRLRAERAAVERAVAEARQRAAEKLMAQRTAATYRTEGEPRKASDFHGTEDQLSLRCRARLERHQRIVERAAKALAEKNVRDILAQREQAERNRLAETLDADVRRWSSGKEGNLRALLSTLQYVLGPESGWQPISLTDVLTAAAVKKAYRKATLCVHPDKLQQRGVSIPQKYICEKVFDLLKDAWNKFNSEER